MNMADLMEDLKNEAAYHQHNKGAAEAILAAMAEIERLRDALRSIGMVAVWSREDGVLMVPAADTSRYAREVVAKHT